MSGYAEGILVLLAINVVYAYAAYLPIAAGQLNLGVAGFAAIGGYFSAYLSTNIAMSPLLAIPLGGAAAGLIGLAVAVPVLRTRGIYLALATFALGEIVRASILNLEIVGGAAGYPVTAYIRLPTVALFALGVTVLVWLLFATRFGVAITAVHDDERVADLMGLNVRAFQVAAFTIGSALAGIGGGLYAHHFSYIEAQYFSISLSISIVLFVLFGGTQSVVGPLLGAAVFTLLPEVLRGSAQWRYVLFAAILIVVMVVRPQGLVTGAQIRRLLGMRSDAEGANRVTGSGPILMLDNVSKHFGGLAVIENLSFSVRRGTCTGLIGPNGAGKTTVFNLITGVYPIDEGRILIDDVDIAQIPSRRRIHHGVARNFQNIRLMPHLSAMENVLIGQHCRNSGFFGVLQPVNLIPGNRWREEARAALSDAGLGQYERATVGSLPYGLQKRIELVRALMAEPRLLLLDEPAAGLNPAETDALRDRITTICRDRGITLLVVEHDMQFVGALCSEVIVLNFGRKIAEGTPEKVREDALVREAYLGTDATEQPHAS